MEFSTKRSPYRVTHSLLAQVHVFSLGALLFTSADYSLLEDEEPELSEGKCPSV